MHLVLLTKALVLSCHLISLLGILDKIADASDENKGWKRWFISFCFFWFKKLKISKGRFLMVFWILFFRINFVLKASNQTVIISLL